jgi:hypothetical protein
VFEHARVAGDVAAADVGDVLDAVVAAVDGRRAAEGAGVELVLDALGAVGHGFSDVAHGGGVADGRADSPAAVPALQFGQAAGLAGRPLVDEHRHVAGAAVAAEAGEDLLAGVHISSYNKIILQAGRCSEIWRNVCKGV